MAPIKAKAVGTGVMPAKYEVDYSRFTSVEDPEPTQIEDVDYLAPDDAVNKAYEAEMVQDRPVDKLREMKIKLAMDAYEKRRPKDKIMHHYVIKDAGDVDAIGEYYATGDERNSCPIYKNSRGVTLTREKQPVGKESDEEQYGWILGNIEERRPLYGVMGDDLSVPTLSWQGFTAPEPVPTVRYYSHASAARMFKDKGNAAIQAKEYVEAEGLYTKALSTKMDPNEFPEPYAMILSNRAQVRLILLKYDAAADDADMSLRHLRNVTQMDEPTEMLKQKTFVRRAKALAGMKQFHEAETVMKNARMQFPDSDDIEKTWKEMQVARSSDVREAPQSGPSGPLLRFVGTAVDEMQTLAGDHSSTLGDALFPSGLAKVMLKLEYIFSKAEGEALADVQTLFRANGGLRTLLHIVKVQWKSNLEGKHVDMHKLDSLRTVLSVVSMACDGCSESVALAAWEAPAFFAALGGCNRKVDAGLCRSLVTLVAQVWSKCNVSKEAVQACTIVVERAAAFLSKLILRESSDGLADVSSSDAPVVSKADKDQAFDLLSDLSSQGGRLEKRTVRGAAPMLASFDGTGFLTSDEKKYREIGELFLQKAIKEPSILSSVDVTNLLIGVQLLIMYGPGSTATYTSITLDGLGSVGSTARYPDLNDWVQTEDGRYAAQMLEAVAKALESRLVKNSHELGKDDYEAAFAAGHGWTVCIPLAQAPEAFANPALTCMCAMPSMPTCASSALGAILGFPTPESNPAPVHIANSLGSSATVRMCVAKFLSKIVVTDGFMSLLKKDGEKCVRELGKMTLSISLDGKSSLEALHDMLYVLYMISQSMPEPLCQHTSEGLVAMLVGISKAPVEDAPAFYAKGTLSALKLNHKCNKVIQTMLSRFESGVGADAEDVLKAN